MKSINKCETTSSSLIKVKLESLKGGGWTEKTPEEIITEKIFEI